MEAQVEGEAGAILFSLVQTCRGLGIHPREYLEDVMRRIMGHSNQKLHELLPDEWLKSRTQKPAPLISVQMGPFPAYVVPPVHRVAISVRFLFNSNEKTFRMPVLPRL